MPVEQQIDLAERLLADDEQALEDILRCFGPAVQAVLTRKFRGILRPADVEDLLAIGLYRLWAGRRSYDPQRSSLRVWFFRIVENAARDVLKHGWHKAQRLEVETAPPALAALPDHRGNGRAGPVSANNSARQQALRAIVAGLPQIQQYILEADVQSPEGTASARDLAEELHIPPATVRVYRKRALDKVRNELERRGFR